MLKIYAKFLPSMINSHPKLLEIPDFLNKIKIASLSYEAKHCFMLHKTHKKDRDIYEVAPSSDP